ncbi:MAG: hypothetical protein HY907_20015 [Deltaproteobacteria bacterium]|nr:hypothetical protein [Deltaproteobacteria bacterium]
MRDSRQAKDEFPVPAGLQALLRLANADGAFLQTLIEKREAAADAAGVRLTRSERTVLRSVPAGTLAGMARAMPPAPPARLPFLRRTAATAVLLLGGAALADAGVACKRAEETRPAADAPAGHSGEASPATGTVADAALAPDGEGAVDTEGGDADQETVPGPEDADGVARDPDIAAPVAALDGGASLFGVSGITRPEVSVTATLGGIAPDRRSSTQTQREFEVALDALQVDGPLDPGVVRRLLAQRRSRFLYCAEKVRGAGEDPVGRVTVSFRVDLDGRVARSAVTENSTSSGGLPSCLSPHIDGMVLPQADAPTEVRVDLVYRRSESGS